MWIFLWLLLSAFIIGVFVWSMRTLWLQKRAWAAFAERHGLVYQRGRRFNDPPRVEGSFQGKKLFLATDTKQTQDVRGERYVTVIEIELPQGMPAAGVMATAGMAPYLEGGLMSFTESYVPEIKGWKSGYILRCRDEAAMRAYMNPARLKVMTALFSLKGAQVLYLFDEQSAALRIETSDPLRSAAHVEKMVKQFIAAADKLAAASSEAPIEPASSEQGQDPTESEVVKAEK